MTGQAGNLHGGCLCGRVRYRVAAIERTHLCHCDMCRRATGSAFAVLSWVKADNLHWVSAQPKQRRSSPLATRGFCFSCGTPLILIYDKSDEVALYGGTLDEPELAVPAYNYNNQARLPWVTCGATIPNHPATENW
ncbi:GFA family protein [Phyllobacterium ifriqiyense]|uniref:GFA family protein n=1 Tax=Phyllobacterium ifriqiyense TaxID=314238 RepID=UPI00352096C4